jgi:hypothetical protein
MASNGVCRRQGTIPKQKADPAPSALRDFVCEGGGVVSFVALCPRPFVRAAGTFEDDNHHAIASRPFSHAKPEIVVVIFRYFSDNGKRGDGSGKTGKLGSAERSTLE